MTIEADRPELTGVAGVPETALGAALLARLPVNEAPAPWTCTCEAVLWTTRGSDAAVEALPPSLRPQARAVAVVGALIRYHDTPVGSYDEVLGIVVARAGLRPVATVVFMAVDSEASLVGGRTNWAMPKTLARFTGGIGSGSTISAEGADVTRWSVSARPTAYGPALPLALRAVTRQEFPAQRPGASTLRSRGRLRAARVAVDVSSDGPLPTWLRPGSHVGALVERARFTLGEPRLR
jgi:hypothetical protein